MEKNYDRCLVALFSYAHVLAVVMAAALTELAAHNLYAADSTSTWTNAVSGDWDIAANWTPNTFFPNNGNGGFATHDAIIDAVGANYTVTLDTNVTVEDLTLSSANATLRHTTGTFTATDGIDLLAGVYTLDGGNISGTTINHRRDDALHRQHQQPLQQQHAFDGGRESGLRQPIEP